MRENNVFVRLKERVCRPEDRFERIENGLIAGMPDVNYCIARREGWIEIKAPQEPVRDSTPLFGSNHKVEVEQVNWMLKQERAGGVSWLFIATEKRLMLLNGGEVGHMGRRINTLTALELERISKWRMLLPNLDHLRWLDLRETLIGP